jgi:hypothetical protein
MADQEKKNKEERTEKKHMKRETLVGIEREKGYKKERQAESKG